MELECARAIHRGIPAVAFTEHVDFAVWGDGDGTRWPSLQLGDRPPSFAPLDIAGYQANIEKCREMFPDLRVLSGIEAGEPHLFPASVTRVLGAGSFDRVLGSLHCIPVDGRLEGDTWTLFTRHDPYDLMERYFAELFALVEESQLFEVLAHCDYPRRSWPTARVGGYREADFEDHYRSVFQALASSQRVLEINTGSPLASAALMRWWWEEGGQAVSFGSDAHRPSLVGDQFELAVHIVEAAGFRPGRNRFDFWRR